MKSSNSNKRIRTLLNELDISQTEFCNRTGITKSALSNYLNGDRIPRQDQLSKIADTFNINPSWLMGYDVPMEVSEDLYMGIVKDHVENKYQESLLDFLTKYRELYEAAQGCTEIQIKIAVNMLNQFKRSNNGGLNNGISKEAPKPRFSELYEEDR